MGAIDNTILPTAADIEAASQRLAGVAVRTPLINAPVLDENLRLACLGALECSRQDCRDFALGMTWGTSARIFLEHVTHGARSGRKSSAIDAGLHVNMSAGVEN